MLKQIWGVNICVFNLEEAAEKYEALLGCKPVFGDDPEMTAYPGMKSASFNFQGYRINLLTSDQKDHPVRRFLDKRGEGLLLVSILSDDLDNDTEKLRAKGVKFLHDKNPEGKHGKVNFIHPKNLNGVQWEIVQPSEKVMRFEFD
jgi:methylmalonyl-CoA/ethylmalonyl-CoA epimerase